MTIIDATAPQTLPHTAVHQVVGLRPGVDVVQVQGGYELRHPWGRHQLRGITAKDVEQLIELSHHPIDDTDLLDSRLRTLLISIANLVTVGLVDAGGNELILLTPINRRASVLKPVRVDAAGATLSRFAYLRHVPDSDTGLVLESPLSCHRMTINDPGVAAFLAALCTGASTAGAARAGNIDAKVAELLILVLGASGFLERPNESELALWDFHDLLFHSRSRYGLHDYVAGGMFAHTEFEHAAALQQPESPDTAIDLDMPDWDKVLANDPGFTQVLEDRRSVRAYRQDAIDKVQLGELLYRAARARGLGQAGGEHPYASVDRPYPMGGGLGELEIYLAVHRCEDLPAGIYRYDSAGHRLFLRNGDPAFRQKLYEQAWLATGGQLTDPQVQLCITSRLARVQWKYSSIAYSVTLKHVGVLFQNLYLVATAMGLSPCGNGSGDTDLVSRAIGVDWMSEPPVGEFLIGGRPAEARASATGFADVVRQSRAG